MNDSYHEPRPYTLMQPAARVDAYPGNQYEDRESAHSRDQRESSQYANPPDATSQSMSFSTFRGTDYQCYNADSQNGYSHNQHTQTQQLRYRAVSGTTWDATPSRMSSDTGPAGGSVFSAPTPTPGSGDQYLLTRRGQNGQTTTFDDGYRAEQRTHSWQQDKNDSRGHFTRGYSGERCMSICNDRANRLT